MSKLKSESISSLVDNYSPSSDDTINAHLVDNIIKDEELSRTWQNYHLIGDVLRDEVPESLDLDLSDTIAAAIAQEATILSPNSSTQLVNESESNAVNALSNEESISPQTSNTIINATSRFKAKLTKLTKPLGQVAIAASAAVLMIVGVQTNVAEQSVTPSQVVQTVPLAGYANPVSFNVQSPQVEQTYQSKQQAQEAIAAERVAQQRRLQALLKDHNQQVKLNNSAK